MADGAIRESDLIQKDGSIELIIGALADMDSSLRQLSQTVAKSASEMISSFKNVSSVTREGRNGIIEMTDAASKLEAAQRRLAEAQTETGRQLAVVKNAIQETNRSSVENSKLAKEAATSYNKLAAELKQYKDLYKSLSEEERKQADLGGQVIDTIRSYTSQLSALDKQMKPVVQEMTRLQKAQQELAFLQSDEGKALAEVQKQIAAVKESYREQRQEVDALTKAQQKLEAVRAKLSGAIEVNDAAANLHGRTRLPDTTILSDEGKLSVLNAHQAALKRIADEEQRVATLTATANLAKEGSYQKLAAEYELARIAYNRMSMEERNSAAGQEVLNDAKQKMAAMKHIQESMGNFHLSVGDYKQTWNGLGMAMNQVIRELPAATVSLNTFFLAISNNMPILADEIQKAVEKNKLLKAEGKYTVPVFMQLAKSIFSWQTLLVLGLTVLSAYGKELLEMAQNAIFGTNSLISLGDAMKNVAEHMEKSGGAYGDNIVKLKQLQSQWKDLTSNKERIKWIKANDDAFRQLDISIRNVSDAEDIFVNNTEKVLEAMKYRAMATASAELAAGEYKKAIEKQVQGDLAQYDYKTVTDAKGNKKIVKVLKAESHKDAEVAEDKKLKEYHQQNRAILHNAGPGAGGAVGGALSLLFNGSVDAGVDENTRKLAAESRRHDAYKATADKSYSQAKEFMENGDRYMTVYSDYSKRAKDILGSGYEKTGHTPRARAQRDMTDLIWRNDLSVKKKYEMSIATLQDDNYTKRAIEAENTRNQAVREAQEKMRKNQAILDYKGKDRKPLTQEQIKQINEQQSYLKATILNAEQQLSVELDKIEKERNIKRIENARYLTEWSVDNVEKSLNEQKEAERDAILNKYIPEITTVESLAIKEKLQSAFDVEGKMTKENQEELSKIIAENSKLTLDQRFEALKALADIEEKFATKIHQIKKNAIDLDLQLAKAGSEEELRLKLRQLELEKQIELAKNANLPPEQRVDPEKITQLFKKKSQFAQGAASQTNLSQKHEAEKEEWSLNRHSSREDKVFELNQQKKELENNISLANSGKLNWSDEQLKKAKAQHKKVEKDIGDLSGFKGAISDVADNGLGGGLLAQLGFDDKAINTVDMVTDRVVSAINTIIDAEIEAAEKAVEAQQKRVDAAEKALDAEVEARKNGFANNVATAKKELQEEKKRQQEKQKLLEDAKRKQAAVDTVMQISSLVTATAQIWKSLAGIPIIGPGLAIAATATMWGSFAAAKIRASQIAQQTQDYGHGGIEFMQGGSHASGNDIPLGVKNSRGRNMKVEGGEAVAVINKKSTAKYRKSLPMVVKSINKGTFEETFSNAFSSGTVLAPQFNSTKSVEIDLSRIEAELSAIRERNETQYLQAPDGTVTVITRNTRRTIK